MIIFLKGQWDSLQISFLHRSKASPVLPLDIIDAWKGLDLLFAFLQYVFFWTWNLGDFARITCHWNSVNLSFGKASWDQGRISDLIWKQAETT